MYQYEGSMNSLYCVSATRCVKNKMGNVHGFRILFFLSFCLWCRALSSSQKAGLSSDCRKILISSILMHFFVWRLDHFTIFFFSRVTLQVLRTKRMIRAVGDTIPMLGNGLTYLLQVSVLKMCSCSRCRSNRCVIERFKILLHISN